MAELVVLAASMPVDVMPPCPEPHPVPDRPNRHRELKLLIVWGQFDSLVPRGARAPGVRTFRSLDGLSVYGAELPKR